MIKLFHIVLISIIFSGCLAKKGATSKGNKETLLSEKNEIALKTLLIKATTEKVLGNYENAEKLYLECLKIDSKSAVTYFELSGIYLFKHEDQKALEFAEKAVEYNDTNDWYKTNLAVIYQELKMYESAEKLYKKLVTLHPERNEYQFTLAEAYLYQGKINDALDVYTAIEEILGPSEDLTIHKHRLYLRLNQPEKAIEEIQKLIDQNPSDVRYYGLLAELYENEGDETKALEIYNKMLELDPSNGKVHLSLYEYYRYHGNLTKALAELKLAFENSSVDIDTKMQIMLQFYTNSERNETVKTQAYELAEILIKVHPDDAKSYSIYGDFLSRDKKFEEALVQFKSASELDQSKFPIWSQIIFLESDLKKFRSLEEDSKIAIEIFPTHPTFYFFNGIANIQLKNYDAAIESLNAGKELVFNNDPLLGEFYQYLGDAYHGNNDHKNSDQSYSKSLEYNGYNPYVLNNYSYYLSQRKENLDLAEQMAIKANEQAPNNPSFMDTYAWILFLKGEYVKADEIFKQALLFDGETSGTILEHYGDVLFKLGKETEALEYWKKAKEKGNTSNLIDEKIYQKIYIE